METMLCLLGQRTVSYNVHIPFFSLFTKKGREGKSVDAWPVDLTYCNELHGRGPGRLEKKNPHLNHTAFVQGLCCLSNETNASSQIGDMNN